MPRLSIALLGPFSVTLDGQPVTRFQSVKVRALLAYLAAEAQRPHARDVLASLLWPDSPQRAAVSNLRFALSDLRRAIGDRAVQPPFLLISRDTLQFNPASDYCLDVLAFEHAAEAPGAHPDQLRQAVDCYRGEFLEGFSVGDSPAFEDWLLLERERLGRLMLRALQRLAEDHAGRGEYAAALPYAWRQVALEPLTEAGHQQLMRWLALDGQRSAALVQYEQCRQLLAAELGVEPEPATQALYQQIKTGQVNGAHPADRSHAAPTPRHNLPRPLTRFIGREREIVEVQKLLSASRLLTVTGPGGCGKTRLALRVAEACIGHYADGVWLVELSPLAHAGQVPAKVATTFSLREEMDRPLAATLADHLRDKQLLLVLDNCEHLVQACAQLTQVLLQACPHVQVVATSREVLGLAGERAWRVSSLSLPHSQAGAQPTLMDLTQSEAVQLFVDRAAAALPGFAATDNNAAAIAQVCVRLDGLPLAIELAAARVAMLRVEQIATRLDDRFSLLTGGSRAALPQHQTLAATLDWSYELLSPLERTVLQRLSVFAAGWSLEAAESVCAGPGLEGSTLLDVLTRLAEKSLVVTQREQGFEARYFLLETIREYAQQRLSETGQVVAVRRQHASYYLALVQSVNLQPETMVEWLDRFVTEHDNLKVALDWSFDAAPDLGLQLAEGLWALWFNGGYLNEGRTHLKRALALTETLGLSETRARLLFGAGGLAWQQGDYAAARAYFEEDVALCRSIGLERHLARVLALLGRILAIQHHPDAARANLEASLALFRATGSSDLVSDAMVNLGQLRAAQGDDVMARALLEESTKLCRQFSTVSNLSTSLGYLAYLALRQADFATARSLFVESLLNWTHTNRWATAWRLEGFAALAAKVGEPERAARLYGAAEVMLESINARLDWIDRLGYDEYVALARQQLGDAPFSEAWANGRTMTLEQAVAYGLSDHGADTRSTPEMPGLPAGNSL